MAENSIPADLIVNWGQRGMRMVPVNDWTTRGSKLVSGTGLGDKKDMFSAINVNFIIGFIPLQLILYY